MRVQYATASAAVTERDELLAEYLEEPRRIGQFD
jgi:hypothetical protein